MKKTVLTFLASGVVAGCAMIPNHGTNMQFDAPFDRAYVASVDTMKEMGIVVTDASKELGAIKGKKGEDSVTVTLSRQSANKTEIAYSTAGGVKSVFNMGSVMSDSPEQFFNKVQRRLVR